MRTRVLNFFHTFFPDAQAERDRLMVEELRLSRELAKRGEGTDPPKRRISDPPEDLDGELRDVRAQVEEQNEIIKTGVAKITIKGLSRNEFRRLLTEHEPRDGESLDQQLGYNCDTFGDALIRACIVSTETLDGEPMGNEWGKWADQMTNGQWEEVFTACLKLTNDGSPNLPR